jgi:hypothetical protein
MLLGLPGKAFLHCGIRLGSEVQGGIIMSPRKFHGGRPAVQIRKCEIKVGVRVIGIEFQGFPELLFRGGEPFLPAEGDSEITMCTGAVRLQGI